MDPLMHIIIPIFVLTAVGYKFNNALKYSFLGVLPDVFYYTPLHRNLSHSYFLLVPVCIVIYLLTDVRKARVVPEPPAAARD